MPKALAVVAAFAALLALTAWLLFGGSDGPGGAPGSALAAGSGGPAAAGGAAVAPLRSAEPVAGEAQARGPGAAAAGVGEGAESAADERKAVGAGDAAEAASEVVEVELVEAVGEGQQPVGDAEVSVLVRPTDAELQAFGDLDAVDEAVAARAVTRRSDPQGLLRIGRPAGAAALLVGRTDTHWGYVYLAEKVSGRQRLVLRRDATLRVQVVDAAGRPQPGVRVALRQDFGQGGSRLRRTRTAAGERAVAEFAHVQETVQPLEGASWAAVVDGLIEPLPAQALDPRALPAETIALVVPAGGALRVRVCDFDGTPWRSPATVTVGLIRAGEPRRLSAFSTIRRPTLARGTADGVATFPLVALGCELEVAVTRGSNVATRAYGKGPERPGEVAEIEVRCGADHPVVRLRAVDASGAAVVRTALLARVDVTTSHIRSSYDAETETDGDGVFSVDLESGWTEDTRRVLRVYRGSAEKPDAVGEVDLSRELEPGVHYLGNLVLGAQPLLVRGRVVDDRGNPIAHAELVLQRQRAGQEWWEDVWDFQQQADQDGRFAVPGLFEGHAFRLGARHSGLAGPLRPFEVGDTDLVLRLSPEGSIEGRVLLDKGFDAALLRVEVAVEEVSLDHLRWADRRPQLDQGGAFRLRGLLAGRHSVRVLADRHEAPALAEVKGVQVPAGGAARDPRLTIDLRGELWAHRVELVEPVEEGGAGPGEAPRARLQGSVRFARRGAADWEAQRPLEDNRVHLVARSPRLDLEVAVRGFRTERLEDVGGDIEVRLRRGPLVRIVLGGAAALPEPPVYLKAVLVSGDGGGAEIDWGAPPFDASRQAVVRAPAAGRLRVRWIVERTGSGSTAMATSRDLEPAQEVDVVDQPGVQDVHVALTEEQMQLLLQGLR